MSAVDAKTTTSSLPSASLQLNEVDEKCVNTVSLRRSRNVCLGRGEDGLLILFTSCSFVCFDLLFASFAHRFSPPWKITLPSKPHSFFSNRLIYRKIRTPPSHFNLSFLFLSHFTLISLSLSQSLSMIFSSAYPNSIPLDTRSPTFLASLTISSFFLSFCFSFYALRFTPLRLIDPNSCRRCCRQGQLGSPRCPYGNGPW